MATVTLHLGLCGSGKTWLAEKLQRETGALFDMPIGEKLEPQIVQCLKDGRDCVVEELFYCVEPHRARLLAMLEGIAGVEIRFICFENDLGAANANVMRRTNKGEIEKHLRLNHQVSPHYTYPANREQRTIHRIP